MNPSIIAQQDLPLPSDPEYEGNVKKFIVSEIRQTNCVPLKRRLEAPSASAITRELGNQPFGLAAKSLCGSSVVIVISQQRVWIGYFWEIFFMSHHELERNVLHVMRYGDGSDKMPGLWQYTYPRNSFSPEFWPTAIILTPAAKECQASTNLQYGTMVANMAEILRVIVLNLKVHIFSYVPNSNAIGRVRTGAGKVLVQYNPAQALHFNLENAIGVDQHALVRVWIEDRPIYAYQKLWVAHPNQVVAETQHTAKK